MKRLFILGLIVLLAIAVQFVVPTNPVPFDDDVGTCYVLPSGMDQVNISYEAASLSIPAPDLRVSSLVGVEKSTYNDFMYSSSTTAPVPVETILFQSTTANLKLQPEGNKPFTRIEEGLIRSHESNFPWAGEMVRHI